MHIITAIKWWTEHKGWRGTLSRHLGIWGRQNIIDKIPCQFYVGGVLIPKTRYILWPIGLIISHKLDNKGNIVHNANGVFNKYTWCYPRNISYHRVGKGGPL